MYLNETTAVQNLLRALEKGGAVSAGTIPLADNGAARESIAGDRLRRLILEYSRRRGTARECVSLTLTGYRIEGDLNLMNCGLEGAPLLGLRFSDCLFERDVQLDYAFLKSLVIEGSATGLQSAEASTVEGRITAEIGSVYARGVTVIDLLALRFLKMHEGSQIDLSESRLRGGAELVGINAGSCQGLMHGLKGVSVARSIVGSDLCIDGVCVLAEQVNEKGAVERRAFDAEELKLTGSLHFGCIRTKRNGFLRRNQFSGEINLQGASIGGQLTFEGLRLRAKRPHKGDAREHLAFAIRAEGASIGGDLTFTEPEFDSKLRCRVAGQIDLTGVSVGGDFLAYGKFSVNVPGAKRIRAFRAGRMRIKGDLRFGYVPFQQEATDCRHCEVVGECDFSGSEIGGKVVFSGSTHRITPEMHEALKNRRVLREQKQAIHLKGATIGSELWFESGKTRRCEVEGVTLTAATVGGRLLVEGAKISAPITQGARRYKALSANGARIRGGIMVTVAVDEEGCRSLHRAEFIGGIRLRNATLDGPVQFKGVKLQADASGYALWAGNTHFGSDVLIQPWVEKKGSGGTNSKPNEMVAASAGSTFRTGMQSVRGELLVAEVDGELCFQGAKIQGRLWVQGAALTGGVRRGIALDCFTAEVSRSLALGSFEPSTDPGGSSDLGDTSVPCSVTGLVSLAHLKAQGLTLGANASATVTSGDKLTLRGCLVMRNCTLQSTVSIINADLQPTEVLTRDSVVYPVEANLTHQMLITLKRWGVYRGNCTVYANYALLGTRLYVRLRNSSHGLISLYAARTGTIGGLTSEQESSGYEVPEKQPTQIERRVADRAVTRRLRRTDKPRHVGYRPGFLPKDHPQRECWGKRIETVRARDRGKGRLGGDASKLVLLNIDEFTYERTNDLEEPEKVRTEGWFFNSLYRLAGRPTPARLGVRYEWLNRMVGNPGAHDTVVISAHRQLAQVYRAMGNLTLSYAYTRERRWLQILYGKAPLWQKGTDFAYSTFFGFGYSSFRAFLTITMLYGMSVVFVCASMLSLPTAATTEEARLAEINQLRATQISSPIADGAPMNLRPQSTGTTLPVKMMPVARCYGQLCEPSALEVTSPFHLPESIFGAQNWMNIGTESAKLILPLPRLGARTTLALRNDAPWYLHMYSGLLSLLSWILFPVAIATISGVLRESP